VIVPQALLDRILPHVQKPARYTGGEWNSIVRDWDAYDVRVALVFPDVYEIGMSNLGLTILYDILNHQPGVLAERVFAPWVDMEGAMRAAGMPLFSLETRHALTDFDLIGLSLPYEQLFTNVLNLLDLAGLPVRAAERDEQHPSVVAGGAAAFNPEPMADFIDAFVLGEGEEVVLELVAALRATRGQGRDDRLRALAQIRGVYVPSLYAVRHRDDGTVAEVVPLVPEAPPRVVKRVVATLPPPVTRPIVPFLETVHNRAPIEIQRGCGRGCRFCHAGMVYRPVRERPVDEVVAAVEELVANTGFEEVALLSLSSSDHAGVERLVRELVARLGHTHLSISLPSLRIESVSVELMEQLQATGRRGGFTFAPEAATERLRAVINKPIPDGELLAVAEEVFRRGWKTIKLYFMIGQPTQTLDDVAAIVDLARRVRQMGRQTVGRRTQVNVGVSTFVPKPHTPFQWVPLADLGEIRAQIALLKERLRGPGLKLNWNDPQETLLEAVLARGDRRLGAVIHRAWELGARFDAWSEQFRFDVWRQAFGERGIHPDYYARRERPADETLPWDHLDPGVSNAFLWRDYQASLQGETRPACREQCTACGIVRVFREERASVADGAWVCPPV
jgi:radical SAM family uncharacterized protein